MKTKTKVTTTLIISFALLFAIVGTVIYIGKKQAAEVAVEVAADAVTEESTVIEDTELAAAKANLYAMTGTLGANVEARGLLKQETEINIEEENALVEEEQDLNEEIGIDLDESVNEAVSNSVEDIITSTLSTSEPEFTFNKVLPKVSEFLNIRSKADQDADVVGKLYKNSYAQVVERGAEWTKIKSGSVEGYANNDYLYFDDDAVTVAKGLGAFKAEVTAGSVNVRVKPTTDSEVLNKATLGDVFTHVPEMDHEEWVAVLCDKDGTLAYVSKEFIKTKFTLKTAVSKAEEDAANKEAEEKAAEAAKKAQLEKELKEAKKHKPASTNRSAIKASDEEIMLLATVVAMEAGGESYDGQLAVANVVINRMLDGYWGKSIKSVVYAPGQFSGANSGRIEKYAKRVTESNKKAAIEALAGNNNIGNYMFFIMKGRANYSSYKKYYVLGCHCFYSR